MGQGPAESPVILIAKNPKAFFDYHILSKLEAGLVLKGSEVKSLRNKKGSIAEAFARVEKEEVFLHHMTIPTYEPAGIMNHEPGRKRKLLLNPREIRELEIHVSRKGHTIVPLSLYFKNGYAKVELGVAQGKTHADKRQSIKKKEIERELRQRTGGKRRF